MDHRKLLESLDAVRPGSADLAQSELADVRAHLERDPGLQRRLARSEAFDLAVSAAMQEVAVPEGLKERLFARLASPCATASDTECHPAELATAALKGDAADVDAASRHWLGSYERRKWLCGALAASAAGLLIGWSLFQWYSGGEDWAPHSIADAAIQQSDLLFNAQSQGDWTLAEPTAEFPLGTSFRVSGELRGRAVSNIAGCAGWAYRLRQQGTDAVLFVLHPRATLAEFPKRPAPTPMINTAGFASSSWQEDGRLYVLVVAGGANEYKAMLPNAAPLARASRKTGSDSLG